MFGEFLVSLNFFNAQIRRRRKVYFKNEFTVVTDLRQDEDLSIYGFFDTETAQSVFFEFFISL